MATQKTIAKRVKAPASNVIRVPKPPAGAYNPDRPLDRNSLLLNQVRHFQQVEQRWAEEHGHTCCDVTDVKTEGQAAEYLRKLTELVHERDKPRTHKAGHQ